MYLATTHYIAIVDVSPDRSGKVPREGLETAYRASAAGEVLLLLDGLQPADCDRVLDALVQDRSLAARGIRYAVLGDEPGPVPGPELGAPACISWHELDALREAGTPRLSVHDLGQLNRLTA
ncbi:MAG: hypothetical protein HY275_11310 [Gemmatimonadetes bacterium]|nr:hypothetical protein [Gemmatimonadota bacterium]